MPLRKHQQTEFNIKRIVHHDQMKFIIKMQGFFNTCRVVIVTHHIKKMENKSHITILIDRGNSFAIIDQQPIIKKNELDPERMHFTIIKARDKLIANIIFNSDKFKMLHLSLGTR